MQNQNSYYPISEKSGNYNYFDNNSCRNKAMRIQSDAATSELIMKLFFPAWLWVSIKN